MELSEYFIERIKRQYTDHTDFLSAISKEPNSSVRINTHKVDNIPSVLRRFLPAIGKGVEWCQEAYYLEQRPNYTLNPLFHAGCFYPQESSSMFLHHVLRSIEEEVPQSPIVLDLCAAPGGKSTLMLSWLNGRGFLVANEVVRNRAWILRENIAKWGAPNAIVTNLMPKELRERGVINADVMLIDAPCSGEGMFRKDEKAITEWTSQRASECAERQRDIVAEVWPMLKKGGFLIYSTCTFNPADNQENIAWIMDNYDVTPIELKLPDSWGVTIVESKSAEGVVAHGYSFLPHKVAGEGFFICVMRKNDGREAKSPKGKIAVKKADQRYLGVLKGDMIGYVITDDDQIVAMPEGVAPQMYAVAKRTDALWCGVAVGQLVKKDMVWAPELPLSESYTPNGIQQVELDERQALEFLHGNTPEIDTSALSNGRIVVTYANIPLGMVNRVGANSSVRLNNCYPKEWRIKMNIDNGRVH